MKSHVVILLSCLAVLICGRTGECVLKKGTDKMPTLQTQHKASVRVYPYYDDPDESSKQNKKPTPPVLPTGAHLIITAMQELILGQRTLDSAAYTISADFYRGLHPISDPAPCSGDASADAAGAVALPPTQASNCGDVIDIGDVMGPINLHLLQQSES